MKALTKVALAILLLALPVSANAQFKSGTSSGKDAPTENPENKKNEEKAYNNALGTVPTKAFDPWGGMREKPSTDKPAAAKKKPAH